MNVETEEKQAKFSKFARFDALLAIIQALNKKNMNIVEISAEIGYTVGGAKPHVACLVNAGVVVVTKRCCHGQQGSYSIYGLCLNLSLADDFINKASGGRYTNAGLAKRNRPAIFSTIYRAKDFDHGFRNVSFEPDHIVHRDTLVAALFGDRKAVL